MTQHRVKIGPKHCPFCKSWELDMEQAPDGVYVRCHGCKCYGPTGHSIEDAITKWNGAKR